MPSQPCNLRHPLSRSRACWLALGLLGALAAGTVRASAAEAPAPPAPVVSPSAPAPARPSEPPLSLEQQAEKNRQAGERGKAALAEKEPEPQGANPVAVPASQTSVQQMDMLDLLRRGGPLMYPIGLLSLLVVAFGFERLLGVRRRKVVPSKLVRGLAALTGQKGSFDPRQAYRLCQKYPSSTARVVRTMLLKLGRPCTEVEQAVREARESEAARLYSHVRWLNLATGVAPLLGLLGTVQGMIQAFFHTANLPTGVNRAAYLAEGIYVALVTTFAGLCVAIPAAVLAHHIEGRIQRLFRDMEETLARLLPYWERYEGRLKVSREELEATLNGTARLSSNGEELQHTTSAAK